MTMRLLRRFSLACFCVGSLSLLAILPDLYAFASKNEDLLQQQIAQLMLKNAQLVKQNSDLLLASNAAQIKTSQELKTIGAAGKTQAQATASQSAGVIEALNSHAAATDQAVQNLQGSANRMVDSSDQAALRIAELKAALPQNSIPVWLAAIGAIGIICGTIGTVVTTIFSYLSHTKLGAMDEKVGAIQTQTDGMQTKMINMSVQKGRDDVHAEEAAGETKR